LNNQQKTIDVLKEEIISVTKKLTDERKIKTSMELKIRKMQDQVNEVKVLHSLSEDSHDKVSRELEFINDQFEE
jgi:DNA gyrase/topoisomerase IV subunit A